LDSHDSYFTADGIDGEWFIQSERKASPSDFDFQCAVAQAGAWIVVLFYVAGRRVNVLLALLPSALHIDPPPGSGELLVRISRTKDFSRLKINYSLQLAFWFGCAIDFSEAG
jgi:hypothetical protein